MKINLKKIVLFTLLSVFFGTEFFAQEKSLKVITYNIWNGYDWGKDTTRRIKLVNWVKEQNTDIVALQELCNYSAEKLKEDALDWGHEYSILLKNNGYSVGLTSKDPIELKEKIFDKMHHGALHCKTSGIDIFIIHLSPGSYLKRREETKIIIQKLNQVVKDNSKYIVMGDFNAHSPFDADLYKNNVLLNRLRESNKGKPLKGNLVGNELDYSVLSEFLSFQLIDICQKFTTGIGERGSFPARSLGKVNDETDEQLVSRMERIDYIMVSPELAKKCTGAKVLNEKENWFLSDHYPVEASFLLN